MRPVFRYPRSHQRLDFLRQLIRVAGKVGQHPLQALLLLAGRQSLVTDFDLTQQIAHHRRPARSASIAASGREQGAQLRLNPIPVMFLGQPEIALAAVRYLGAPCLHRAILVQRLGHASGFIRGLGAGDFIVHAAKMSGVGAIFAAQAV